MKSISKWLVPGFLQRLDQYLRERYPVIWYCGAHWVLFYGLMGGVLLFGAGLLYPVHWVTRELISNKYMNLDQWVVDPIKPIEFAYDELSIYSLFLVIAISCIWIYRQFQLRPFFYRVQHSLFCLLIYGGCWWVLCGITATAFRMGTIVKTAWIWMPERDLQDFKQSGIYPYGFISLKEDSMIVIPEDHQYFFQKREKALKNIWKKEASWGMLRYQIDPFYWRKRLEDIGMSYFWTRSYQSYRLHSPQLSSMSISKLAYQSSLSDSSDLRALIYWQEEPEIPEKPDLSDRSYLVYQSYQSYMLSRVDRAVLSSRFYLPNLFALDSSKLLLQSIYHKELKKGISHPRASVYSLNNYIDTLDTDPLILIPSLPNQIEDAVRSVEHARQFLNEGIFWRYFWHLPGYLLWIAILLLLLSRVSAQRVLPLSLVALLIWFCLQIFEVEDWEGYEKIWKSVHLTAYLLLPLTGLLFLLWMLWQQKQGQLFITAVNMVFLGVLIVLLGALNFGRGDTLQQFGSPIDAAFYGAQVIGLLAACVVPYVQVMPKAQ